jgi:hypothetical protein
MCGNRSARPPNYNCNRAHIFGLNASLYSGDVVYSINRDTIVYASAAVGIVHDIAANSQTFFEGHSDDITCIALAPNKLLAATGQLGKKGVSTVMVHNTM